MVKTVKLIHPDTDAVIAGTITDDEYAIYIEQGYEEVTDTPA
jgi:hypothetical protein